MSITTALAIAASVYAQSGTTDFTAIKVSDGAKVNLYQSDSNSITATSNNNMHLLSAKVEKGVLVIHGASSCDVHVKTLKSITADGAAKVESQNQLTITDLEVKATDASRIKLNVKGGNITAIAEDAGTVELSGTANKLDAKAQDGSTINATDLQAGEVISAATDGGDIKIWALNKIAAKANDGSSITYKGSPADKDTYADDGGIVKTDDGKVVSEGSNANDSDKSVSISLGNGHDMDDAYIGFGYVFGPEYRGARIMYGRSREFNIGFGQGHKFCNWNGIGYDLYYKSTDFFLEPDADKVLPNATIHNQEKISFNNFGLILYDRFYFGNMFLDGGVYGDWIFYNRNVSWDNSPTPDAISSSSMKTIDRKLNFVNPFDYGVQFRFGFARGASLYFNYRLSQLIHSTESLISPPQLPPYVVGITFGIF